MKIFMLVLSVLLIAYVAIAGLLYVFQRSFIYSPDIRVIKPVDIHIENLYREVEVKTEDGLLLNGWYHAPSRFDLPVIIWFHGNGGHYAAQGQIMKAYIDKGYGSLLAGYRGYSGNQGSPSETGLYKDADAWINFLMYKIDIRSQNIVLYGESLGSGIAVEIATRYDVGGVILQSPYSSIADIAFWRFPIFPVHILLKDKYDSLSKIQNITAPLLVLHGGKDKIIPIRYGKKLFSYARSDRTFYEVAEAGHNDLYRYGIEKKVISFLDKIYSKESSGAAQ